MVCNDNFAPNISVHSVVGRVREVRDAYDRSRRHKVILTGAASQRSTAASERPTVFGSTFRCAGAWPFVFKERHCGSHTLPTSVARRDSEQPLVALGGVVVGRIGAHEQSDNVPVVDSVAQCKCTRQWRTGDGQLQRMRVLVRRDERAVAVCVRNVESTGQIEDARVLNISRCNALTNVVGGNDSGAQEQRKQASRVHPSSAVQQMSEVRCFLLLLFVCVCSCVRSDTQRRVAQHYYDDDDESDEIIDDEPVDGRKRRRVAKISFANQRKCWIYVEIV